MSVALSLRHATLCETQLNSIKIRVTTLNIVLVNGIYCIEVTFWFHFTCDLIWCWCLICSSRLGTGAALISTWSSFGFLSLTLSLTSAMIWIGLDLTNTSLSCPHHSTDRGWGQQRTIGEFEHGTPSTQHSVGAIYTWSTQPGSQAIKLMNYHKSMIQNQTGI